MSSLLDFDDASRRQREAADGQYSVWVGASAGTGKTKVLTDRVLNLMLAGSPASRILCLTFTKAAAAEMANRISDRLSRWATAEDGALAWELRELTGMIPEPDMLARARRLFAGVLDAPGGMKIETIHAFCQSLLRRFPLEAGVAPHFEVMDDRSAGEALAEAREAVLATARSGDDPDLAAALAEVTRHAPEAGFGDLMSQLALERARMRRALDRCGDHPGFRDRLHALLGVPRGATVESLLADACSDARRDEAALRRAADAMLASKSQTDRKNGERLAAWLADPAERTANWRRYLELFLTQKGERRKDLVTKTLARDNPAVADAMTAEAKRVDRFVEAHGACALLQATVALIRLGDALLAEFEQIKRSRALLDYDDLVLKACALLERPGVAPWVLFKLDGGLHHILIDEAQDTNPEQWQVVAALAGEFFTGEGARPEAQRTVFAVGDEKQSIYSFQRADPAAFARMREHFAQRVMEAEAAWRPVDLDTSFRSTEVVLRAVDAVFARPEARDGVTDHWRPHLAARRGHGGCVEVWSPVEPADPEPPLPWEAPVRQLHTTAPRARLAYTIAGLVRHWLDGGERLEARGRLLCPGDVMVLVRRRGAFVGELVRALKQRDVPVAGVDRMLLTDQLSVQDLMALGDFLLLPEDDLTLATVLKGPLYNIDEETLFGLAYARGGSLWAELRQRAASHPALLRAAEELSSLLARADFAAPYELYADVLGARGGRRAILARLGPEAADPIDEFLSLALAYERQHVPSLQGFLHWLATGEAEIKRDLDQRGRDEVRVLTVHGSKGLQAPVVFLPDTLQTPNQSPSLLWTEDEQLPLWAARREFTAPAASLAKQAALHRRDQEYRRLLYVALTRAEDRLYVCGWRTRQASASQQSWYELVAAGLAGIAEHGERDFAAIEPEHGWKAAMLRLDGRQIAAPRDDLRFSERRGIAAELPAWAGQEPPSEPAPPRPLTPSRPAIADPPARSPLEPGSSEPSAGVRRGLLVHRLLQSLPELPETQREAIARRFLARPVHGLSPAEQDAIATETLAVLRHPEFAPLFMTDAQAEVPIVGLVGEQALSGRIDRLVVTADEVLIVDYKTLRPPPTEESEVPPAYLRQLAAYASALSTIYPDRRVRTALLWTDGPRLMPISPSSLARWAP